MTHSASPNPKSPRELHPAYYIVVVGLVVALAASLLNVFISLNASESKSNGSEIIGIQALDPSNDTDTVTDAPEARLAMLDNCGSYTSTDRMSSKGFVHTRTAPDEDGSTIADLKAYLISPQRAAVFEAAAKEQGAIITRGLLDGKFGKTVIYDQAGGQVDNPSHGWFNIRSVGSNPESNGAVFASAWWDDEGTLDTSRVHAFSLINEQHPFTTKVIIDGPHVGQPYWSVTVHSGKLTLTNDQALQAMSCYGWGGENRYRMARQHMIPNDLEGIKALDMIALIQIKNNLKSWDSKTRSTVSH